MSPRRATLLAGGGAVGRKLDFLAQEFNREVEYAVLEVERRVVDRDRAGTEGRGRPVPRAGAESGVAHGRRQHASNAVAIRRRGLMLVLSSPSGAGKIDDRAQPAAKAIRASSCRSASPRGRAAAARSRASTIISCTMREFERLRDSDALLEWAEVHGNCYATPREPAEAGAGARAATCCSTSTGKAPSSSRRRCAPTSSRSSSCRRR